MSTDMITASSMDISKLRPKRGIWLGWLVELIVNGSEILLTLSTEGHDYVLTWAQKSKISSSIASYSVVFRLHKSSMWDGGHGRACKKGKQENNGREGIGDVEGRSWCLFLRALGPWLAIERTINQDPYLRVILPCRCKR